MGARTTEAAAGDPGPGAPEPRPESDPSPADGRTRRSQRTRDAIVGALVQLVLDGDVQPTAQQVADRAGVSLRSVYGHFSTTAALHHQIVEHVTHLVLERLQVIDAGEPTAVKVDLLCGQRARINEDLGPLLVAAGRLASGSPELASSRRFGRAASLAQVDRVFGPELAPLPPGARARRAAAIHALLQVEAWVELRDEAGLDAEQARLATAEAVARLLGVT